MSRTPTTPFIPPLPTSPDSSPAPEHPPVIPTGAPSWNQSAPIGGSYAPYASPYSNYSPFIPQLSPMVTPGVVPGAFSPPQQQQPKVNRHGLSEDFTGYPQGPSGAPPLLSPNHQPQMSAYSHSPYGSHAGSHPNSPHYPQPGPSGFQSFGTPWASNTAQLPSTTPWAAPPQRLPTQAFTPGFGGYGPPPPLTGPPPHMMHPPHMMGGPPPHIPPPHMTNGQGPQGWPGAAAAAYQQLYGPPDGAPWGAQPPHFGQPPYRVPPEPPAQIFDRMDPFTEGKNCTSIFVLFIGILAQKV